MAPRVVMSQSLVLIDPASPLSPRVKVLFAIKAPLAVKPDVAVIRPEMVGVAVQAVPETVRLPPREVRFAPETVKVLSNVVAPWRVKVPGVVVEPIVLMLDAPVPRVVLPLEVRVVKAPELGVVEPIVPGAIQVALTREEALIVPVPVYSNEAPVPTTMAAMVLVALVMPEKGMLVAATVVFQDKVPEPLV